MTTLRMMKIPLKFLCPAFFSEMVSKFAIIFPTGVYSTATYFISRIYFNELQTLSIVVLIAGIIVLLVILGELMSPPFAIHRKTAEP